MDFGYESEYEAFPGELRRDPVIHKVLLLLYRCGVASRLIYKYEAYPNPNPIDL